MYVSVIELFAESYNLHCSPVRVAVTVACWCFYQPLQVSLSWDRRWSTMWLLSELENIEYWPSIDINRLSEKSETPLHPVPTHLLESSRARLAQQGTSRDSWTAWILHCFNREVLHFPALCSLSYFNQCLFIVFAFPWWISAHVLPDPAQALPEITKSFYIMQTFSF